MARRDCQVCIKNCTPSQLAECGYCDFDVCKDCMRTWLLSSPSDPACMNCKADLPPESLQRMVGATWTKTTYKTHREDTLFDRELAKIPETEPFVEAEKQRRENRKRVLELQNERNQLRKRVRDLDRTIYAIETTPVEVEKETKAFIQRCGDPDCDGFLNRNWTCHTCDKKTCRHCGILIVDAETHVCREEDKASLELIRSDSRQCVSCGTWTFKTEGCNQMFCVSPGCNTAWDWRTGRKVTGPIHNPEYFRMRDEMNLLGRDLNDVPCGGLPTYTEVTRAWGRSDKSVKFLSIVRLVNHVTDVELRAYPNTPPLEDNREMRVSYILGEVDRVRMKTLLQRTEKKNLKNRNVHNILQMFATTVSDFLRQAVVEPGSFDLHFSNVLRLIDYTNVEMEKVAKQFNCVVPFMYTSDYNYWRVRKGWTHGDRYFRGGETPNPTQG